MRDNQIAADDIADNKQWNLLDVRSKVEYLGIFQGAADERAGTIPAAHSLPYDWMARNGSGLIADKQNLQVLISTRELDEEQNTVVFCHTIVPR